MVSQNFTTLALDVCIKLKLIKNWLKKSNLILIKYFQPTKGWVSNPTREKEDIHSI